MQYEETRPGALWRRLAAAAVDGAVIALAVAAIVAGAGPGTALSPATLVLAGALTMFYRVLFEGSRLAATPGKLVFGLRVLHASGGQLSYATAALRAWPWWLSGAMAGVAPSTVPAAAVLSLIAVAAIPLNAARLGLHDRMAGTRVVRRERTSSTTETTDPQ